MHFNLKTLSVNEMWQGGRRKSWKYLARQKKFMDLLPPIKLNKGVKYSIRIDYKFSNKAADIDNPTKAILDCLSKKRGFNDNQVYHLDLRKLICHRGHEGFTIRIYEITEWYDESDPKKRKGLSHTRD